MPVSPQRYLSMATLFSLMLLALCVYIMLHSPWFGVSVSTSEDRLGTVTYLSPHLSNSGIEIGDRILAFSAPSGEPVPLNEFSMVSDPDRTGSYEKLRDLFVHVARLYDATRHETAQLHLEDGRVITLASISRELASLPLLWWLIAGGVIPFIVSAGVWSYRRDDEASQLLLIAGTSFMLMALSNLVYAYRQPSIDPFIFEVAVNLNRLATYLFFYMYVAIFWVYPKRLGSSRLIWVGYAIVALLFINEVTQGVEWPGDPFAFPMVVGLLLSMTLIGIQFYHARNNPLDFAALQWFALALMAGMVIVTGLYFLPAIFAAEPILTLELAFAVGIISYLGLIMAVARYRLFELGEWWLSAWMWLIGGTAVIALDVMIAMYLKMSPVNVLVISLLVIGWVYFPIRQYLWRRLFWAGSDPMAWVPKELLRAIVESNDSETLNRNWVKLLTKLFNALKIDEMDMQAGDVAIADEGLSMIVPSLDHSHAYRISYRSNGRRLFTPNDIEMLRTLLQMAKPAVDVQIAKEEATRDERERIMRDLHDDVCSRLLTLRHRVADEKSLDMVDTAMRSLRQTIYSLSKPEGGLLHRVMAEWRNELAERLDDSGVQLHWHVDEGIRNFMLTAKQMAYISQVIREAVTNAIRHASPTGISVSFLRSRGGLELVLENDGCCINNADWQPGNGMANMKRRISDLGGSIEWMSSAGKSEVRFFVPISNVAS